MTLIDGSNEKLKFPFRGCSLSTNRCAIPSDAVSLMVCHPRFSAILRNSASITVLPTPLAPVILIKRPGAPDPLSRPSSKSASTISLPMRTGGRCPALGLNGLILVLSMYPQFSRISGFMNYSKVTYERERS